MRYFTDLFNVDENELEEYGAFNVSLINDLPLFIDPFLLFASEKTEYQQLHHDILKYLSFLKSKAQEGLLNEAKIRRWYTFPEVKQVWFGYSQTGNGGAGLGKKFAESMSTAIVNVFKDLNKEQITKSSHLEKLGLFQSGVGRDNISDFTCNLIKGFLLEYTQNFAKKFIDKKFIHSISVSKAYFDYERETWRDKIYNLPFYNDDYVLLTPKDILTKDDTWINFPDMKKAVLDIINSIPNIELRDRINDLYIKCLPKNPKDKDITFATERIVKEFPEFLDYYIRTKEEDSKGAIANSKKVVEDTNQVFVSNMRCLEELLSKYGFYNISNQKTYEAAMQRVLFLKDVIENKDGYRLFYAEGKPIKKERDLQLLFKLTWYNSDLDVNAEVNNGRGPVDYKISRGSYDSTLVEFKLASNTKLTQNLKNQVEVYKAANNTNNSITVIMFFTANEQIKVFNILKELKIDNNPNIVLINAIDDKVSASNVRN